MIQWKRARLVLPADAVKVEQARKDALAVVGKLRRNASGRLGQPGQGSRQANLVAQLGALDTLVGNEAKLRKLLEVHGLQYQFDRMGYFQSACVNDQIVPLGCFAGTAEARAQKTDVTPLVFCDLLERLLEGDSGFLHQIVSSNVSRSDNPDVHRVRESAEDTLPAIR